MNMKCAKSPLWMFALPLLLLIPVDVVKGQYYEFDDTDGFGPVFGLHSGDYLSIEGGVGMLVNKEEINDMYNITALSTGLEVVMGGEEPIFAPRVAAWHTRGIFTIGLGGGYYFGDGKGAVAVQPEIGLGIWTYRITWRINLLMGDHLQRVSTNDFSLTAFLPL